MRSTLSLRKVTNGAATMDGAYTQAHTARGYLAGNTDQAQYQPILALLTCPHLWALFQYLHLFLALLVTHSLWHHRSLPMSGHHHNIYGLCLHCHRLCHPPDLPKQKLQETHTADTVTLSPTQHGNALRRQKDNRRSTASIVGVKDTVLGNVLKSSMKK